MRFKCSVCGYEYDECAEGKKFNDLSSDWRCPICGASKDSFEMSDEKCAGE